MGLSPVTARVEAMACRLCFSCWSLVCCLVVTVAEGQERAVTPPAGSRNNVDPADCQIFTLTPPPPTRRPVTRIPPITRTPRCPFRFFPQRRPTVHFRLPSRPFLPSRCNRRFQYRPGLGPFGRRRPYFNYFPGRNLQSGSSSEES